jgi:hypothetical protein
MAAEGDGDAVVDRHRHGKARQSCPEALMAFSLAPVTVESPAALELEVDLRARKEHQPGRIGDRGARVVGDADERRPMPFARAPGVETLKNWLRARLVGSRACHSAEENDDESHHLHRTPTDTHHSLLRS